MTEGPHIALSSALAWRNVLLQRELSELVGIDSPSSDIAALGRTADWLHRRAARLGPVRETVADDGRRHLLLNVGERPDQGPLVLCHYDTVWPCGTAAARPMRIDGGRAYGPGIFDMKAGIILALHCLEALMEVGLGVDAQLLMTSDEEIGSRTSWRLIAELARPGRPVLVLEPPLPGGVLKLERKGTATIEITMTGRSAHAGVEPEAGASAVEEAASVCRRLVALRAGQDEGSSLVVGTLSGGTASNVVAAEATMQLDLRAWSNQSLEVLTAAVLELTAEDPRVKLSFSVSGARPPLVRQPASDQLLARFQRHAARAGLDVDAGRTGGASDGNLAQSYGATVLDGLGLRGAGAHADDEHIELDHIVPHAFALASLLHELSCA